MLKWWNTGLCNRVVDRCLQLHGGYGYMREYPIAKAYLDARIQTIFGGTTEIMKQIIGRSWESERQTVTAFSRNGCGLRRREAGFRALKGHSPHWCIPRRAAGKNRRLLINEDRSRRGMRPVDGPARAGEWSAGAHGRVSGKVAAVWEHMVWVRRGPVSKAPSVAVSVAQ